MQDFLGKYLFVYFYHLWLQRHHGVLPWGSQSVSGGHTDRWFCCWSTLWTLCSLLCSNLQYHLVATQRYCITVICIAWVDSRWLIGRLAVADDTLENKSVGDSFKLCVKACCVSQDVVLLFTTTGFVFYEIIDFECRNSCFLSTSERPFTVKSSRNFWMLSACQKKCVSHTAEHSDWNPRRCSEKWFIYWFIRPETLAIYEHARVLQENPRELIKRALGETFNRWDVLLRTAPCRSDLECTWKV